MNDSAWHEWRILILFDILIDYQGSSIHHNLVVREFGAQHVAFSLDCKHAFTRLDEELC